MKQESQIWTKRKETLIYLKEKIKNEKKIKEQE